MSDPTLRGVANALLSMLSLEREGGRGKPKAHEWAALEEQAKASLSATPDLSSLPREDRVVLQHAIDQARSQCNWPEDGPELQELGVSFPDSYAYAAKLDALREMLAPRPCSRCRSMDELDDCRTCGVHYCDGGDGWDGECPDCADKTESKRLLRVFERKLEKLRSRHVEGDVTDDRCITLTQGLIADFDGALSPRAAYLLGRLEEATGGSFMPEDVDE